MPKPLCTYQFLGSMAREEINRLAPDCLIIPCIHYDPDLTPSEPGEKIRYRLREALLGGRAEPSITCS